MHFAYLPRALRLPIPCASTPETVRFVSRNRALRLPKPCASSPETVRVASPKSAQLVSPSTSPCLPKDCRRGTDRLQIVFQKSELRPEVPYFSAYYEIPHYGNEEGQGR